MNKIEYTYDGYGLRRTKKVGGVTTTYTYDSNGKLIREVGENSIEYVYGADGIIGIIMNQAAYLFRKNVFGDITHIYNEQGELVGKYSYTAFGECTVDLDIGGIASDNPIRYRGYYYDEDTSLYYLKTRYYDPEIGRFMTIDGIEYLDPETINGLNLYAYCGNDPINKYDPTGHLGIGAIIGIILGIGALAATANDIFQIVSENVYVDMNNTNSENVHIENSYKKQMANVNLSYILDNLLFNILKEKFLCKQ